MKNRELKFRVWAPDERRMIANAIIGGQVVIAEYDLLTEDTDFEPNYYSCDNKGSKYPFVVMQFTGLKDKKGKDIYEGDIIKHSEGIFQVVYDNKKTAFGLINDKRPHSWIQWGNAIKYIIIIGNIYETPELLKSSNEHSTIPPTRA